MQFFKICSGHTGRVTSLSVSPCGQWLASISPCDGFLRIWETATNYCFRNYALLPNNNAKSRSKLPKNSQNSLETRKLKNQKDHADEDVDHYDDSDEEWSVSLPTALVQWNPNADIHLVAAAMLVSCFGVFL